LNLLFALFISIKVRGLRVWFQKLAIGDQFIIDVILDGQLILDLSETARKQEV
jgi:hypothetical protein